MLFTHLYLLQVEKTDALFVSTASREYFGVESTDFLSAKKFTKKLPNALVRWMAKYVFFPSEAIKIAVSFSNFQCLYAILLLTGNSKHGFSVA